MMRFVFFCHSLRSCWNHGNAHFLRGVVRALLRQHHEVMVYESRSAWSAERLRRAHGQRALDRYREAYPELISHRYDLASLDLDDALRGAEVVIVHEWNDPELIRRIGVHHRRHDDYCLLFHDTHHRAVSAPQEIAAYDLRAFDGVLAFGEVLRRRYLDQGWARRAWTWHEAADITVFRPRAAQRDADLVWIGNWGDEERSAELREFLLQPATALGLRASIHGVRYPGEVRRELAAAGIRYGGWMANHRTPDAYARHRMTVHVPRRPYAEALPGIPTIRVFEALACGIPLVCAPWQDSEGLFSPGEDYLVARDGDEMRAQLAALRDDDGLCRRLADHGRRTVQERHSCSRRAEELIGILAELGVAPPPPARVEELRP